MRGLDLFCCAGARQMKKWWSKRQAMKREERIAANTRDIGSGVVQRVKPPLGLDYGYPWYTTDGSEFFRIMDDGRRLVVWNNEETWL